MRRFVLLPLLLLTLASGAGADTQLTTIDDPHAPAGFTQPLGINDRGDIVGNYRSGTVATDPLHGFLLRDGIYTTIDDPLARGVTVAQGINSQGDIVGLFVDGAGSHGFLLHEGAYTTIDVPRAGGFTSAAGINAQGTIAGRYQDAPGGPLHGFTLIDRHYNTIDAPQASGITNVFGINDRGDLVGAYNDAPNMMHGFVLRSSGGRFETIDAPKAAGLTVATGINSRDDIVGYYADRTGALHGFLLRNGHYATIDGPNGVGLTQAFGINSRGDIVGKYSPPQAGFLLAGTAAPPDPDELQNAAASCRALKANIGSTSFARAYRTFGRCVSNLVPIEQLNVEGSRSDCTAEQNDLNFAAGHGGRMFEQFYGTVEDAFGKCVLAASSASSRAEQQARANPSRTCRSVRAQMGATAFSLLYGKKANSCSSSVARAQTQDELRAAADCRAEQDDVQFATDRAGKTFAQVYGTGVSVTDAFGRCVAYKASGDAKTRQRATVSAAKTCLSRRTANRAAFRAKYGTFGRCVYRLAGTG
jgi:uncharacterized membrane protein